MTKTIFRRRRLAAAATMALAAALSACGKGNDQQMTATSLPPLPATLPLSAAPSTAWPTAPEVAALPDAAPIRTVRVANPRDDYGYADAAYDYQDVLGDAPPDYYFDYDGVDPWVWEGYDQSVVFLEPIYDGYRYYYYRPGADEPYFVRDPDYGYGYDDGQLAVIYDSDGAILPYADYGARRDYAARYLWRGRQLYDASRRNDRRAVSAANWAARSAAISAAQARWAATRARQPQWRDYSTRAGLSEANYWRAEAVRRQADTRRFAAWRDDAFRSPPPPRAIPATWTSAKWAHDQTRFPPARADRVSFARNAQANRGPQMPQGLFDSRGPVDRARPARQPANAVDPRRSAVVPGRSMPGGPQRPQRTDQPSAARPQANVDRRQPLTMARANRPMPGDAVRNQPQFRRPARMIPARAQPQIGRDNSRPNSMPVRNAPRIASPRAQPRSNPGMMRPRFQAPRPQPRAVAPRPQPPRFGGGDRARPAPQMSRPAFQPRAPQPARAAPPRPQAARPAPPPRTTAPAAARGGGNGGHGDRNR